jgi:hypothetical protein
VPRIAVAQAAPAADATATTTAAAAPSDQEEPTVLSPFVVDAAEDKGSYKANSTLAGTRVRTDLKDVASAITVVTAQFLQDTGAKNAEDLLVYTPSTEVSGIRGNFSGAAGAAVAQENTVSATTRVRGLDSADNTRDYFLSDIPWDAFNVGRVDLQRGPNSILFGTGSPAGIINVSTNGASFTNSYNITNRFDEYGSLRDSATINQEIIPGILAIRLSALQDNEKYEQAFAFNNTTRYYGAFRFDPKLFGKDSHTSIRGNYEYGNQTSDNPRSLPPTDEITPWFQSQITVGGVTNPGYNKITENQFSLTNTNPFRAARRFLAAQAAPSRQDSSSSADGHRAVRTGLTSSTTTRRRPSTVNNVGNAQAPSGTPIQVITAEANQGLVPSATFGGTQYGATSIGGISAFRPDAIPPFSLYADYLGAGNGNTGGSGNPANYSIPFTPIPGGVYYTDKVITDPSIFNFYKNLLDGPNKHEWKNWTAFNFAVDQTFFDDRLGFELSYDEQKYTEGEEPWLEGENYAIGVDINQTYANGAANPNVGRPDVAQASSGGEDNNYQTTTSRFTWRFTPTVELRASDFFGNSTLTNILGKSIFTGLYEKTTSTRSPTSSPSTRRRPTTSRTTTCRRRQRRMRLVRTGASSGWPTSGLHSRCLIGLGCEPERPELRHRSAAERDGAQLQLDLEQADGPEHPGYVNPAAPYTYTNTVNGSVNQSVQYENPANYVGWVNENIGYQSWSNPADRSNLVTAANRSRYQDESEGITWQGYFLNGDLVPSLGWRKDKVTDYQTAAVTNQQTGITSLDFPDNLASRTDVQGTSKTWGGVYHFPKELMAKLPGDMTFSMFGNRSENFKPDAARLSVAGLPIAERLGYDDGVRLHRHGPERQDLAQGRLVQDDREERRP